MRSVPASALAIVATLAFLASGCAGTDRGGFGHAETERVQLKVYGMSCEACAKYATRKLRDMPGVVGATVDFSTGNAVVTVKQGQTDVGSVQSILREIGFEALPPGQEPLRALPADQRKRIDYEVVTKGKRFRIEDHLARGKITLFDFHADWCGPCLLLAPLLERLALRYENVALRKIDITTSDSPAAKQALEEFGLPGLPWVVIYDQEGRVIGRVQGNSLEEIEALLVGHGRPRKKGS